MTKNLLSEIFSLSASLVKAAQAEEKTIATAESCTGGLVGAAITASPGSSVVFFGGIIAYHNQTKINELSVQPHTLETFGAVSKQVAEEMASGCRDKLKVDIAVSITGIAGPSGGTEDKPVGTVWIGLASSDGVISEKHNFENLSRNKVRDYSCLAAMTALRNALN